jgi:hypothetical protein
VNRKGGGGLKKMKRKRENHPLAVEEKETVRGINSKR